MQNDLKDTVCELSDISADISESESDLSSDIWDFCESTRIQDVEQEGFKMVIQLSHEIDDLKETLAGNNDELVQCKVNRNRNLGNRFINFENLLRKCTKIILIKK